MKLKLLPFLAVFLLHLSCEVRDYDISLIKTIHRFEDKQEAMDAFIVELENEFKTRKAPFSIMRARVSKRVTVSPDRGHTEHFKNEEVSKQAYKAFLKLRVWKARKYCDQFSAFVIKRSSTSNKTTILFHYTGDFPEDVKVEPLKNIQHDNLKHLKRTEVVQISPEWYITRNRPEGIMALIQPCK